MYGADGYPHLAKETGRNVRVSNYWEGVTQSGPELRTGDSNIAQEWGLS